MRTFHTTVYVRSPGPVPVHYAHVARLGVSVLGAIWLLKHKDSVLGVRALSSMEDGATICLEVLQQISSIFLFFMDFSM